jgi:hypothetical protein
MNFDFIKISRATFIIAIICFFLPWIQLSCGSHHVDFSGMDAITGKTLSDGRHISSSPAVVLAFLLALAGIAITFARGKFANTKIVSIGTAVVGAIGFLLLYMFKAGTYHNFIREKEQGNIFPDVELHFRYGLYFTMLSFIAAFLIGVYSLKRQVHDTK